MHPPWTKALTKEWVILNREHHVTITICAKYASSVVNVHKPTISGICYLAVLIIFGHKHALIISAVQTFRSINTQNYRNIFYGSHCTQSAKPLQNVKNVILE